MSQQDSDTCRYLILATLLISMILCACSSKDVEIPLEYPLSNLKLTSREAVLVASPGVELEELLDLKTFRQDGVWPGITIDEAISILGEPDSIFSENGNRDLVHSYQRHSGDLQIVRQRVTSEGPELDRWFVRFQPHTEELKLLVSSAILGTMGHLNENIVRIRLVDGLQKRSMASLHLRSGKISQIWWLSDTQDGRGDGV